MPDPAGGLLGAWQAAKEVGKKKKKKGWQDTRLQDEEGGDPSAQGGQGGQGGGQAGGGQSGGGGGPGGYYEEDMFGNSTWHSWSGEDLHGQEAVDKADKVFGGPPTDGVTGEPGYYGSWNPSRGGGGEGGQQQGGGGGWRR